MHDGQVNTLDSGEIDYVDLERRLQKNSSKPAILNVNIGTTVRGAVDDLDKVLAALERTGYSEDRFFIHCDGALFGLMVGLGLPCSIVPTAGAHTCVNVK